MPVVVDQHRFRVHDMADERHAVGAIGKAEDDQALSVWQMRAA